MSSNIDHLPSPEEIKASGDISHLPAPSELGYKPMSDVQDNHDIEDVARGAAQGITFGGADELQGGLQALGDASLGNLINNPSSEIDRLKDLYRKYQQASQGEYKASEKRSPYLYGAGQIAGAIAPAILTAGGSGILSGAGAAAESAPLLARLGMAGAKGALAGATAGALGSEGNIIGASSEDQQKLLGDVGQGAAVGGILGAGAHGLGELAGKASNTIKEYVSNLKKEKPFVSQLQVAKDLGNQGISLANRSDLGNLATKDLENSQSIMQKIQDARNMLGEKLGKTVQEATDNGNTIMVPSGLKEQASAISEFFKTNPALSVDKKSQAMFNSLTSKDVTELAPQEALVLRDTADDLLDRMRGDTSTLANYTREHVNDFRKTIDNTIKEQIPGYRDASNRFYEFNKMVPETIIGKGVPAEISGVRYGDLTKPNSKLLGGIQDVIQGSELPGSSTAQSKQTLGMLSKNLNTLNTPENADVFSKLGGSPEDILGNIRKASDVSSVIKQASGVNPQEGTGTLLKGLALSSTTGRGKLLGVANLAGRVQNKIPEALSSNIFDLPNVGLQTIASHLSASTDPTIKSLADSLTKSMANGNSATKNAALFALMQNKDARASMYNLIPNISPDNKPNQ